ncbi:sugar-transfer associated ATP-grasp domain-containing protein [Marinilabilia sp.]|uniref:sugar-transfer associated ATP-grasp domain-containing protein n=1 Tax=Marinilabilia sp. TaxID=2021252 RepID=UPI0025B8B206|nr:sugar-transfer associated ATP-grasp domain-containing protein [Marinilabilia sp.]
MNIIRYKLFSYYRGAFGLFYRSLKKLTRRASTYHIFTGCVMKGDEYWRTMPFPIRRTPEKGKLQQYRNKWLAISPNVPDLYLRLYSSFSGVDSCDFVPASLYYTHVEPMLNNVEFSRSFADKNLYGLLVDNSVLPEVLLRKMNGIWYDGRYNSVRDIDEIIKDIAKTHEKVIVKHAVASQGGENIFCVKSDGDRLYLRDDIVDKAWFEKHFDNNFLVQAYVYQHAFYERFNATSLNTFRVYTYRSVKDDSVHVLSAILRVGGPGSVVDNIKKGGKACGINLETGKLNGLVYGSDGNSSAYVGEVDIDKEGDLYKFHEVAQKAKELARKQFYTRVIGFDFCVNRNGQVNMIELNNYDVGIDSLQMCNGPLFREFTDEVIDYCKKKKKNFRFIIR